MTATRFSRERSAGARRLAALQISVCAASLAAIAFAALTLAPASQSNAVVRISLDRVPEERVVEYGHELPRIAMVNPVPRAAPLQPAAAPDQPRAEPDRLQATAEPARNRVASVDDTGPQAVEPDQNGVLPIGFSLTEGVSSQQGGVGVAKTLAAEGGEATGLTIFLIGGSEIEVDRGELLAALAQLGAEEKAGKLPPAGDNGRLSLQRVRTAGLDLQYDAIRDRLVLRP